MNTQPIHLLINLPAGFFTIPALAPIYQRLEALGEVRKTSCNSGDEILPHLQWADAVLMWSWPKLTPQLLDACPNLRFSANLDITQDGARILLERGVPVSVARRAFSPAVAEMALALILGLTGNDLRRWSLEHRGYLLVHVVAAVNPDDAFTRLLTRRPDLAVRFRPEPA